MWETHENSLSSFFANGAFSAELQQRVCQLHSHLRSQIGACATIRIPSTPLPCTVEILLLLPPRMKLNAMLIWYIAADTSGERAVLTGTPLPGLATGEFLRRAPPRIASEIEESKTWPNGNFFFTLHR